MKKTEYMDLYQAWNRLPNGPRAELRRVNAPDDLLEIPAFYRLLGGRVGKEWQIQNYLRLIFCLPCIKAHTDQPINLGAALARSRNKSGRPAVSEKRLIQVIRSTPPNDMIQLRRIIRQTEPTVNWPMMGESLWYWGERSKRNLLEHYFLNQTSN